jgi:hypothetical protein
MNHNPMIVVNKNQITHAQARVATAIRVLVHWSTALRLQHLYCAVLALFIPQALPAPPKHKTSFLLFNNS